MRRLVIAAAAAIAFASASAPANATAIQPTGYSTWGVWGYPDNGGKELTDGVIADRHYPTYYSPSEGYGAPYVGWHNVSPQITFSFDGEQEFSSLALWVDYYPAAGVVLPSSVSAIVNGVSYDSFTKGTPLDINYSYTEQSWPKGGGTPYTLNLNGAKGSSLELNVQRGGEWTFISEVQFAAANPAPAPLAAGLPLALAGAGLALTRLRRRPR